MTSENNNVGDLFIWQWKLSYVVGFSDKLVFNMNTELSIPLPLCEEKGGVEVTWSAG